MIDPTAIYAFADRQKRLLLDTYNRAWRNGVAHYGPDSPPDAPDNVRRAVALAPSYRSVNKMVAELAALMPKPPVLKEAARLMREDYNPDEPRDAEGRWGDGGSSSGTSSAGGFPTTPEAMAAMTQDVRNPTKTLSGETITPSTPLLVFHGTEREDANHMLTSGARPSEKPMTLGRSRFEAGEQAEFAPGVGMANGLYVTGNPADATGYGHYVLAVRTTAGALAKVPESTQPKTGLDGILGDLKDGGTGVVLPVDVPAERIRLYGTDMFKTPPLDVTSIQPAEVSTYPVKESALHEASGEEKKIVNDMGLGRGLDALDARHAYQAEQAQKSDDTGLLPAGATGLAALGITTSPTGAPTQEQIFGTELVHHESFEQLKKRAEELLKGGDRAGAESILADIEADGEIGGAADVLEQALTDWVQSNAWRLDGGDSVAWAGEQNGYGEAADADGQLLAWNDTGDDRECDDCKTLASMPPQVLADWPCSPGDGATECNVGCRCSLEAVGTSVLPGDIHTPQLSDEHQAVVDKLATAQAQAMSAMMPDAAYLE